MSMSFLAKALCIAAACRITELKEWRSEDDRDSAASRRLRYAAGWRTHLFARISLGSAANSRDLNVFRHDGTGRAVAAGGGTPAGYTAALTRGACERHTHHYRCLPALPLEGRTAGERYGRWRAACASHAMYLTARRAAGAWRYARHRAASADDGMVAVAIAPSYSACARRRGK